ncbi:type VI secretion protein IcmF/TssM N-terminal domain-containing protein [Janthinobacterium sp. PC23-8]|uniref:type VI secretion protein IcmF/TssM N-terminal domain-containing protein n=1 Tax=Janthinobacterium sp. PC23-8 TaxID=2012679 RepID=UPI000B95E685|nr:type VI secretion protein IcmF/TssM N-terminal domain-containing protein [Janthinobacterium sp. PC23-8]OYO27942.1 hypothetical protein CD932_22805 [Janthinobacterium sp. PC23-8]
MKTFGKFLLLVLLLGLLGLSCWGLALYMAWPLWVAVAMFCGMLGLYFLLKLMRRCWIVMRSRSKLAQQSRALHSHSPASPESLLRGKWKAAVATLRGSSLRQRGNALYVLPWFMVIGKSGTGKTTALTRARLSSPIQKLSQRAVVQQTENCDWWYFDQAVVIDSAGRYVDAQDAESDRREWELGLDLLARYRPREGLDGLVLAISTERLHTLDKDSLVEEGRVVRARIEQLIQMFGKRFPVYVLVTKCDQLYGLEQWALQLPEQALEQAMGYLSDDGSQSEAAFLDSAFGSIGERLRQLRIALVGRAGVTASPAESVVDPSLLLFPAELQNLQPRLEMFVHACLADNPYLERPFLRGLFFSSGMQQGGAVSSVMGAQLPPVPAHPGSHAGLFLHDFFGSILPQDRHVSRPVAVLNRWRKLTRNIGVAAWLLISIALAILLSLSFIGNLQTLTLVREQHPFHPPLRGVIATDVAMLAEVNDLLLVIEQRNASWQNRWMVAATNIGELDSRLKQSFVNDFRQYILPSALQDRPQDFTRLEPDDHGQQLPGMIRNLVRGINLMQAREHGADRHALQKMPSPLHIGRASVQFDLQLQQLLLSYLAWMPARDPFLNERTVADQALLERVAYVDPQMRWLIALVQADGINGRVNAADFWSGSRAAETNNSDSVPASYTHAGQLQIAAFLDEMQAAVADAPAFLVRRAAFEAWYRDQRMLAWQKFIVNFASAESSLRGEVEWRSALGGIVGSQSPYYRVIDRLNAEFRTEADKDLPGWLLLARQFQQLREQSARASVGGATVKVLDAINTVGGNAVAQTLASGPASGTSIVRGNLSAVDTLARYQNEINRMAATAVSGTAQAYQLAAEFHQFGNDPAAAYIATGTLVQLKQLIGHQDADADAVWKLIEGPLNFTLSYIEQQASCELQKNWQAQVQWPLQTVPDKAAMIDQLYGAKGSVWAFADGIGKPFLTRDAHRFRVVETSGHSVPFTAAFLPMLNTAVDKRVTQLVTQQNQDADKQALQVQQQQQQLQEQQRQLQVQQTQAQLESSLAELQKKSAALKALVTQLSITAQPTGVNGGARAKPFETVLSIQCAAGAQQLKNYNFPVSASFPWTVGQCGDVNLQIKIGALVVSKKYAGTMGLPDFLRDFHTGTRQFDASQFPSAKEGLEALGVKQLLLRYNFQGQDAILQQVQQLESIDKQQKELERALQTLKQSQSRQAQDSIAQKLAAQIPYSSGSPPSTELFLPPQIGVCWGQDALKDRSQNMQAIINTLVDKEVASDGAIAGSAVSTPVHKNRQRD